VRTPHAFDEPLVVERLRLLPVAGAAIRRSSLIKHVTGSQSIEHLRCTRQSSSRVLTSWCTDEQVEGKQVARNGVLRLNRAQTCPRISRASRSGRAPRQGTNLPAKLSPAAKNGRRCRRGCALKKACRPAYRSRDTSVMSPASGPCPARKLQGSAVEAMHACCRQRAGEPGCHTLSGGSQHACC